MKHRSHTIIHSYIDKSGYLRTNGHGIVGGSDKEAMHHFNAHVRATATTHKNVIGIVLIDAAQNVLGEWTADVKAKVA